MSLESKRRWILPEEKTENIIDSLLKTRCIEDQETFLNPDLNNIPNIESLHDVKSAVKKILECVNEDKKIIIHGDFDCDGICATSLLWEFLYKDLAKHLNKKIDVLPYIPSRIDQGYGLTESSLNDAIELGAQLLISVDCGVRDFKLIKKYIKEKDLSFIVTDHHQPPLDLPKKLPYPLVHQLYPSHEYSEKEICGTTIAYILTENIRKEVGMEPSIKDLDLVSLATVTDMMPLLGINRTYVKYGLKQRSRQGLKYLALQAGLSSNDLEAYHFGYVLGPRINAAGRIGKPMDAVKLLVSHDDKKCIEIANELNNLNFERQKLTQETLEQAKKNIDMEDKLIYVIGNNWHEGIIGLVAGKLQEEFSRPVLALTKTDDGIRGSARSIKGFNITKTLEQFSEHLLRYGGHELAAGFTVKEKDEEIFRKEIVSFANENIKDEDLIQDMNIDLLLDSSDINFELINSLKRLEPYGYGNMKPLICLKDLVVVKKFIMGKDKNHMKLTVKGDGIDLLTLTLFGCNEDTENIKEQDILNVVGYPDVNIWNGNESIQFNVKEWKSSI